MSKQQFHRDGEPDEVSGMACGFETYILRNQYFGHLCGYVGIPKDHVLYGRNYNEHCPELEKRWRERVDEPFGEFQMGRMLSILGGASEVTPELVFDVHGGITFSGKAYWDEKSDLWWFGFDCNHSSDINLRDLTMGEDTTTTTDFMHFINSIEPKRKNREYRDLNYVREQIIKLAIQLKNI